ncbi:winged helix DNA-binding domain-containing protein [Dinghuibacter silviterrae]|uniref:Winged helix DNA-binding protein n=1 Tax=Dinghuibacter silviterrae TaxID=1539049 RepID=A0A4R8DT22_9BACT|nr:winged helix DNA-binding domain-containing protein [Dinghuibacter silviterrae]TDX00301.1 winged helix DNA-binding protein [Dinghuibacter silviterrae]
MTSRQIAQLRLESQQIIHAEARGPEDLVRRMGCVQAQDFAGAKWALAERIPGATEADMDRAFQEGAILRTHVLRPTWHFVSPKDIRWLLKLSAPKIKALSKGLHRKLDIDEAVLRRSKTAIGKALAGGQRLTRTELSAHLRKARINTDDIRLGFHLMDAEVDGLICSGGREGKQFTYALLEERVAQAPVLDKDAAIGELAARYFTSRGPATVYDFAWWSGLTISQAQRGLEMNRRKLDHAIVRGQAYWFPLGLDAARIRPSVYLLPAFDEYTVAYRDRADILAPEAMAPTSYGLKPVLLVNGRVAGTWKRTEDKKQVGLEVHPLEALGKAARQLLDAAAGRYARFAQKELGALAVM